MIEQLGDDSPRPLVIPANEQGWPPVGKLRVDHARVAHGIERLDEMSLRKFSLESFHERLVGSREKLQNAVHGWQVRDGIGRVDDRFACEILRGSQTERVGGSRSLHRQNDHLGKARRLSKTSHAR